MPVTNAFLDRFVAAGFSTLSRTTCQTYRPTCQRHPVGSIHSYCVRSSEPQSRSFTRYSSPSCDALTPHQRSTREDATQYGATRRESKAIVGPTSTLCTPSSSPFPRRRRLISSFARSAKCRETSRTCTSQGRIPRSNACIASTICDEAHPDKHPDG